MRLNVLNGHNSLINIKVTTISAPELTYTPFLFANLNAHRHCNVLEPIYESLSDILEVMITENEVDSAVQTVEKLIPLFSSTETEVSEMEDYIIRPNHIVPVGDDGFVHLIDSLERAIARRKSACSP